MHGNNRNYMFGLVVTLKFGGINIRSSSAEIVNTFQTSKSPI